MESVVNYFASGNLDFINFLKAVGILIGTLVVLSFCCRLVIGKQSTLILAISSAIGILFIYFITIILASTGGEFKKFFAPLPFVTFEGDMMYLFDFRADFMTICGQLLSMVILSFLMNLIDGFLPTGKHFLLWILFRCLSVIIALILHLVVAGLLASFLPDGLMTYAPVILLGVLVLMLMTGALKFLVGLALTTVNPLIAGLYTFFFANIVGKQITKAILTTGILVGLLLLLEKSGVVAISITAVALAAYTPLILLLVLLWYIVGKLI